VNNPGAMTANRPILVALDGSPRAPIVLHAACDLARGMGAKLLLVRAVTLPVELSPELMTISPNDVEARLAAEAHAELEELGRTVPDGTLAGVRTELGVPWQVLCNVAQEVDALLIVIGAHGYRLLDRILGTTAAKVVNHADRTVHVVRGPAPPTEPGGATG